MRNSNVCFHLKFYISCKKLPVFTLLLIKVCLRIVINNLNWFICNVAHKIHKAYVHWPYVKIMLK